MVKVQLPMVEEDVRTEINILKAIRNETTEEAIKYLLSLPRLSPEVIERLKEYGMKGESYDKILNKLMDVFDEWQRDK